MRQLFTSLTIICLFSLFLALAPGAALAAPLGPVQLSGATIIVPAQSAAATAPQAPDSIHTFEQEVIHLTNLERINRGIPPLHYSENLRLSSYNHSLDMAVNDFFNHTGSDGSTLVTRAQGAGYSNWTILAENIAAGYNNAQAVVAAWMASPGHQANILRDTVREIGVGIVFQADDQNNVLLPDGSTSGPFYYYITQDFGARNNNYPVVLAAEAMTTTETAVTLYAYGEGVFSQMMIANDDPTFDGAGWQPFQAEQTWTLPPAEGEHTVYVRFSDGVSTSDAFDSITLDLPNTAGVSGMVFVDSDSNGLRDAGENSGYGGVQLALRNGAGLLMTATQTDDSGLYHFDNLPAGVYNLEAYVTHLVNTSENPRTVTLLAGSTGSEDFGFLPTTTLNINLFTAQAQGSGIELTWQTSGGNGSEILTLERANSAGGSYLPLNLAQSASTGQDGSTSITALDTTVQAGQSYWYRLQLPDGQTVGPISARFTGARVFLPFASMTR